MYAIYNSSIGFRSIKTPSPEGEGWDEGKFNLETFRTITNSQFKTGTSKQSTQALHQRINNGFCRADFSPHKQYSRLLLLAHSKLKSALQGSIAVWIVSFFLTFSTSVTTANPNGGQVVAGDASITSQGNSLDINQNSHKAIIDWRSFNISQGEETNFKQPSASALTLNRVRGEQLSQINGRLNANGQVFLINPQGVIFGPNAQVTTGGLVATTSDIRNDDFIAGNYQFDQASPNPNASITNQGHITTIDGGAIVLAAPTVNNEGTIQARLGSVNLASANTFTLDFHGDGLLSFEVQGQITQKPDSVSDDTALVNNSGTIIADGGTVTLTAQAADAVIDRVINMDGIIQATTLGEDKGKIILSGGDHGIVDVSGTLNVSGAENNETGGIVHVLGEKVGLFDGTQIKAEGYAGGGEVLVGGNFQGKGPEPNAKRTYVAKKAKINANATKTGDGGQVIVWADETTQYYGDITARGGEQSGDGGFVEISGKEHLNFKGTVIASADKGKAGTILFDPLNIFVGDDDDPNNNGTNAQAQDLFSGLEELKNDNQILFEDAIVAGSDSDNPFYGSYTLEPSDLDELDGKVVLQAQNNIIIDEALDFKNMDIIGDDTIIFQAKNEININANITTYGGNIHLEADLEPSFQQGSVGPATINLKSGAKLESNGGSITLIAQRIDLEEEESVINAGAGNIFLAKIMDNNQQDGIQLSAEDIIVGSTINSDSDVFIAANDFDQIETTGSLSLGFARTAGIDGLGVVGAANLFAPNITIDSNTQFNALQVVLSAQKDIFLNQKITTQGGKLILNPAIVDAAGKVYIEPVQISTNGGDINIQGDTALTSLIGKTELSTDGGNIDLLGTTKKADSLFSPDRTLRLNAGTFGEVKLGDIEQTVEVVFPLRIFISSIGNIELIGKLISLPRNIKTRGNQIYSGNIILNGNYVTAGGTFSVSGLTTLEGPTSVFSVDGDIQFGNIKGNVSNNLVLNAGNNGRITLNVNNESLLLNNPQNDFFGTLNLNVTGSENIAITDINLLQLGTFNIGANQLSIAAQDLNILGSLTTTGGGSLILGPIAQTQSIGVGDGTGTFSLTQSEIDNIMDGFSSITIGSLEGRGWGNVSINNATFIDPLIVQVDDTDASITINGELTGNNNASITLNGSNATTTLNGNIITNGNPIVINDALVLGNPVIPGGAIVLDTTAGGVSQGTGIAIVNPINGASPLTITAGTGVIDLTNPVNTITGTVTLNNNGNNNVNVVNNAPLILGTSNIGSGQLNITGTQISQTGAITQEAGAAATSFSATTGAIDLTQNNDFTSTVSLNNIGANDINIVDINTLNLGASSIETGDFTVTAGDLNIVGAVTNAGGSLTLQPFTLDQNMSINSSSGSFILSSDDISNLEDGFSTITLGRSGLNGGVTVDTVTFTDPLDVLADGSGASITINGELTGDDNASITLNGSNATTTLNGNIITNGNPIVINDALILGDPVIPGGAIVLDTTAGGVSPGAGITFAGTVNGATPLTLSAGSNTGDIQFQRAVGLNTELGNVNVLSANNVSMGPRFLANEVSVNASRTNLNDVSTNGQQQYSGDLRLLTGTYDTGGGDFIVLGNTDILGNTTVSTQGGEIRFDGSVNNITGNGRLSFVLNAGSNGAVNFGSALGANSPLGELIISGSTINLQDVSTVKGGAFFGITFNGNQQYNGTVTLNNDYNTGGGGFTVNGNTILGSNTTVNTTGGNIQLGNISGNTANSLILNAGLTGQILLTGINEPLLLNNPENDFIGTLNLTGTGSNNIDIFDSNLLQLGTSSIGANQFTLAAQELDIGGPLTSTDRGSLVFRPIDQAQSIGLGAGAGTFSLTQPEIDNIDNGFSSITIGSVGNTGNVIIDSATFTDPLIIQADGTTASITINNLLAGTDDASITLNGSGNTTFLNGNILTAGNPIIINDAVILGNTVLLDTTTGGAFTGAGITLNGPVNRGAALTPLTLNAGINIGDILFTGDVGVNTQLGDVTVLSANNINMNGRFLANDTRLTFSGLWQNNGNLPLDVNSLFVTPLAQGATVFGTVNSRGGLFAAPEVTGVSSDIRYTINGCVMGIFCGITGVPDTNIPDLPPADTDLLPVAKLELMNIWEQQKRLQDPRDERYSNLGNEELWWER